MQKDHYKFEASLVYIFSDQPELYYEIISKNKLTWPLTHRNL